MNELTSWSNCSLTTKDILMTSTKHVKLVHMLICCKVNQNILFPNQNARSFFSARKHWPKKINSRYLVAKSYMCYLFQRSPLFSGSLLLLRVWQFFYSIFLSFFVVSTYTPATTLFWKEHIFHRFKRVSFHCELVY